MATPTLIIGIGTSGLYTLEHVQRFYYETYKKNKPQHVEYLYIETNKDNQVGVTPLPNEIKRVYVSLGEMEEMVANLKNEGCGDWLPPSNQLVNAGMGAGGIRSCGRLALWGSNSEGDNFKNVVDAINNAYGRIASHMIADADRSKPTIFITGSFTGGTGSGIFIDMGYLIRHLIQDIKELFGLFLLPSNPSSIRGFEVLYANSFGALRDLDHFNQVESKYKEKWPNGVSTEFSVPPYELVQFLSQDYYDGSPAMSNLGALYKMAGLYLFLNIAGVKEKRMERFVDAKSAGHIDKYGTFGLSAIQFPKDQIQEYVSSKLSIDLIDRWTDSAQYISNNEKKQINKAVIFQQTNKLFDDYLADAFRTLNSIGGKDLIIEIEREAIKINSKNIKGHPVDHISKLFSSSSDSNFYSLVKNNLQSAIDSLIDDIHDLVVNKLNETENLYFTKHVLGSITQAIQKTLDYWKQIGISSRSEIWENILRDFCSNTQKNTYKSVLEQDAVLKDRLLTAFETMKMHMLIIGLTDISRYISKDDIPVKASVSGKELPKTKTIDNFITQLSQVSGKAETQENIFTFEKRIKNIEQDVNDETLPILRIYPSGSFIKETDNSKRIYIQKSGNNARTKDEVIKASTLWDYLIKSSKARFYDEIYKDCLNAYRSNIDSKDCVPDFDVSKYIIDNPEAGIRIAKRGLSPFLAINKILSPSAYLPKFIAGGDKGSITEVINVFKANNFNDFGDSTDRMLELTDMKNIFIFYDEKGGFNLLNDLRYIEQMRTVYETLPSSETKTIERWKNERNAYNY
ncbi:MAG: tubulin-like doman-containing protein [Lentimicrobium sp.]|nr:tubulin-like doman-containing protein [Lentimicrobium sp.]